MTLVVWIFILIGWTQPEPTFEQSLDGFARTNEVYPDSALFYAEQMLRAAHEQEDDYLVVRAEYALGYTYRYMDDYLESVRHYRSSWQLARSQGYEERELMASNGLGMALYKAGDYPEALRYLYMSLERRRQRNIPEELSTIYNNIGLVYLKMFNWDKAHEFFTMALTQGGQPDESDAPIVVNLGLALMQLGRFAEATERFSLFRELCEGSDACPAELWCEYYNAIGGMYLNLEQYASADIYFEKALALAVDKGFDGQIQMASENLSAVARETRNFERAVLFADSALRISLRLKIYPNIANNYNYLAKIYHDAGDLESAARYWKASDSMNIQESEVLNEIYTIAMNEQEQIYDSRILNQSAMLSNSRRNVFILTGAIVVVLVLMLLGWRNVRRRKVAIEDLAEMKEAFARRQKLAALGSLMGGIAHEINTPLASIRASLVAAEGYYPKLTEQFTTTSDEYSDFLELRDVESDEILLGLERRRARKKLEEELHVLGLDAEEYSEKLVDMGFTTLTDSLRRVLKSPHWFNKLYYSRMGSRSNRHALVSVDQIQSVIKSFRSQVVEESGALVDELDVRANIESVLVLLQNQLKYDVEVSVACELENPNITGNGARLSQVWTNLLVNSLQAMTGAEKRIEIRLKQLGCYLRVSVKDTGHGIGVRDQPYIFDNFYSTRHHDSGSGIGLNLTRQIIREHHGYISFLSGSGFTEMNVFLPLAH